MNLIFYFILLYYYFGIALSSVSNKEECVQESNCKCHYSDGTGIDLNPLQTSTIIESYIDEKTNLTFKFHPCADISINSVNCTSSTLCMHNSTDNSYVTIGKASEMKFLTSGNTDKDKFLVFVHDKITTQIKLGCSDLDDLFLLPVQLQEPATHNLVLLSKYSCVRDLTTPSSLSTGSTLVILLFTFSAIYFFGGALILRFIRGARGKEMIPNIEFWSDLPLLVRDGVVFIQNGCTVQTATVYDQI